MKYKHFRHLINGHYSDMKDQIKYQSNGVEYRAFIGDNIILQGSPYSETIRIFMGGKFQGFFN